MQSKASNINYKLITYISLGLMLVIMLFASKDFGISGDEVTQNTYGELVYKYFASGGSEKEVLSFRNVYNYGGFFDLLCVTVNKIFHFDEYNTRHFIIAIFGFLTILYTSLIAKFFKGWPAALLTAWFLFLSPRFFGESMYNPKDIPFALGMVMGVYYTIRLIKAFPNVAWKDAIWLMLSIGLAINIRVGGLLLIPLLMVALGIAYVFQWRKQYGLFSKEAIQLLIKVAVASLGGYLLGLLFWPYGLEDPFGNPLKALGEMSNFSTGIRMLFDDRHVMSQNIGIDYIPKWILFTNPVIVLMGIVASPILFYKKQENMPALMFLFFAAIFPWAYVAYKKSPLYDGWRHLLFIYPLLVVLSTLAFLTIIDMLQNATAKYVVVGLIVIGLLLPAKWSIANYPNQIVYFNELIGGVDGAYGHYETDYYMNSVKQAFYKLAKEKDLYHTKDSVVIMTNCFEPLAHYIKTLNNPRVTLDYVKYRERSNKKYTYGIFFSRFIEKELLQGGYFPPSNTIMTIKADNTPLIAITKPDTAYYGYKAYQYLQAKDLANASYYYQLALQKEPKDETLYINYAVILANTGNIDNAIAVIGEYLKMSPRDATAYQVLAELYKAKGDMQQMQQAISTGQSIIMEEQEGIETE